jgi:hypothetical protein
VFTGNKVANLAFQAAEVRNRLRIARWLKSPSKRDSLFLIRSWPEAAPQGRNPRGFQAWAMAIEGQTVAFKPATDASSDSHRHAEEERMGSDTPKVSPN